MALVALLMCGCQPDSGESQDTNPPTPPYLNISTILEFDCDGEVKSLTINSNSDWHTEYPAEWCVFTPDSGTGSTKVEVSASANTTSEMRTATAFIICADDTTLVTLRQQASMPQPTYIETALPALTLACESAEISLALRSNTDWRVVDTTEWATVSPVKGSGDGMLKVTATNNDSESARYSTFAIITADDTVSISLCQLPKESLLVDRKVFELPPDSINFAININSNYETEFFIDQSSADWLLTPEYDKGSIMLRFYARQNTTDKQRSGYITVRAGDITEVVRVTQHTESEIIRYDAEYKKMRLAINQTKGFGANIIAHEYTDGKGYILFDNTITEIPDEAFYSALNILNSLTIPRTVTKIGDCAFYQLQIKELYGCENVTYIGDHAFSSYYSPYRLNIKSLDIFPNVKHIGQYAFNFAMGFDEIIIPKGITHIPAGVFCANSSLTKVVIHEDVTHIGNRAFNSIGEDRYFERDGVYIYAKTPPKIGNNGVFTPGIKIYVPAESVEAYKSAENWAEYEYLIQPMPQE